jgi:Uncharacterized conserved protein (DUF2304).
MKIVLIQLVLIVVVVITAVRLLRDRGARTQAVRRLGLLLFAAFAVWSILFPSVWNHIARLVGVGRGTDMVMYALVVAFLSFTLTTYVRFREFETRYTKLARRLALDEAGPPKPAQAGPPQQESPKQESPHAGS